MPLTNAIEIAKTKFLNMFTLEGTHDGVPYKWDMVTRHDRPKAETGTILVPDAVHIVCRVIKRGAPFLVVTSEYRPVLQNFQDGFAAGLIDEDSGDVNDDILQSAERELFEETGLQVTEVHEISKVQTNSAGMTDESFVVVYVDAMGDLSRDHLEEGEDIQTKLMSQNDVKKYLKQPQVRTIDGKAELVMHLFAKTGCIHPNQL